MFSLKKGTEGLNHLSSCSEHSRSSFTTDDKVTVIQEIRRIGVRSDLVREGIVTTRCLTDNFPIVSNQFMIAGCCLSFRQFVDNTVYSDGGFNCKCNSIKRMALHSPCWSDFFLFPFFFESCIAYQSSGQDTLQITRTITKNDKHHVFTLNTKTMDPTRDLDTLTSVFSRLTDFDLYIHRVSFYQLYILIIYFFSRRKWGIFGKNNRFSMF